MNIYFKYIKNLANTSKWWNTNLLNIKYWLPMSYKFKNTRIESLTISKQILVTKMKSETKFLKHNQHWPWTFLTVTTCSKIPEMDQNKYFWFLAWNDVTAVLNRWWIYCTLLSYYVIWIYLSAMNYSFFTSLSWIKLNQKKFIDGRLKKVSFDNNCNIATEKNKGVKFSGYFNPLVPDVQ